MMKRVIIRSLFLLTALAGLTVSTIRLEGRIQWPVMDEYYGEMTSQRQDMLVLYGTLLNQRHLAADMYWIKLLTYVGDEEFSLERWPMVEPMGRAGTLLNPRFTVFYEYTATMLAWQLDRWDEAIALLERGRRHNPGNFRMILYLAAISHDHAGEAGATARVLEQILYSGQYPPLLPRILANIYQARGEYEDSLRIWYFYLSTGVTGLGLDYAKAQVVDVQRLIAEREKADRKQ